MASFALVAGFALVQSRPLASIAALWASVMVKLLTLPLIAVTVLGDLVARRWGRVVVSGVLMGAMTILLYLPFGGGIPEAVSHLTAAAGSGSSLPREVTLVVMVAAAALVLWAGVRGRGEIEGTLQGWAIAALTVVPLSLMSSAWYLIMPIAMVSLSGERWRTGTLIALSAVAFLIDSWTRTSNLEYPLPVPFGLSRVEALLIGGAVVAIVGLGVLGYRFVVRRRGTRATALTVVTDAATRTGAS
jgi:hypothetical protein